MLKAALPGIVAIFALTCYLILKWVGDENDEAQTNRLFIGAIGIVLMLFVTAGLVIWLSVNNG